MNEEGRLSKKVYLHVLPNICERRRLDVEKIRCYLEANRFQIVSMMEEADCVLLFGCAFNDYEETISQNEGLAISNYCAAKRKKFFILEGIADTKGSELACLGIADPDKIIGNRHYDKLDLHFGRILRFNDVHEVNHEYGYGQFRQDAFSVQICHGCNEECSYCTDKRIVKHLVSKPLDACIAEIKQGLSQGYKNIWLLGDEVGAYGVDLGYSILTLLERIADIEADFRLSMWEINIKYIFKYLDEFDKILSKNNIQTLGYVGIQSGSDRILRLMNRGYSRIDVLKVTRTLKKHRIKSYYHFIVGFPTESVDDFYQTMDLILRTKMNGGIIFEYRDHPSVVSHTLYPKVEEREIKRRMKLAARILSRHGFDSTYVPGQLRVDDWQPAISRARKVIKKKIMFCRHVFGKGKRLFLEFFRTS